MHSLRSQEQNAFKQAFRWWAVAFPWLSCVAANRSPVVVALRLRSAWLLGVLAVSVGLSTSSIARAGVADCPGGRSSGIAHIFDCRAYEMVSPAYKVGFSVQVEGVSEDGSRMLARSFGSFSDPEDTGPVGQQYEIVRGARGWEATPLDAPFTEFSIFATVGISADFQSALVFAGTPAQYFAEEAYFGPPGGSLSAVGPLESPTRGGQTFTPYGASEDLRRIVLFLHSRNSNSEEKSSLWPGDTTADGALPSLYEYEYTGGEAKEPRLVGVDNVGVPASVGAGHLISNCGTSLGSLPEGELYNAVSASGAAVFFTAAACGGAGPPVNEVYARLRETSSVPAHTVAISEPSPGDCGECKTSGKADAQFRGASLDGSKVFFTTEQALLPSATGVGPYLYEYDFNGPEGRKVKLLSGGDPAGPRVQGVTRVSEDGSHVYFVAKGLLSGENDEHESPMEGGDNLYVFERDAGHPEGRIVFVATLSGEDGADWSALDIRSAQATPDGRFLVFQSTADLTPDQQGQGKEAGQVFEYDAQAETLVRVSRGQNGYNKDGNSSEHSAAIPTQDYERESPIGIGRFREGLAVSADGSRVFFSTEDALTPQAVNGVANIYEYHDGQVGLISDGHDSVITVGERPAVQLIGTDESGRDVFFTTADRLLPQDTDDQLDVYDARVEGGFASQVLPASCMGDSCQSAPSSSPQLPAPGMSTAEEAGVPTGMTQKTKKKPIKHKHKTRKHKGKRRKSGKTAGRRK